MSKEKSRKKRSLRNVVGLVMFSVGIGMVLSILLPGLAAVLAIALIGAGGYILFIC